MRTRLRSKVTLLFMTLGLVLAIPAIVFADELRNDLDASFDANFELLGLQAGGPSQNVNIVLQVQGGNPEDNLTSPAGTGGENGCNIGTDADSEKIEVQAIPSSSAASVKWVTTGTDKVIFEGCNAANSRNLTVTPGSSAGTTNVTFKITSTGATETSPGSGIWTVPSTGTGRYDLRTAQFTVNVTPPPNTPPNVSVTGVTHGAVYEHGAVPAAGCNVSDAEDTNESANPVIDSSGLDSHELGLETVTCSYTDGGGLSETASATYSIVDTTAPVIAAHGDVTAEATGPNGAVVTYTSPATTDAVDGPGTANCTPASGSQFDLGPTTVTCTATDAAGNVADETTFKVTVEDTTAPALNMPENKTAEATGPNGAPVSFARTASDIVDGNVPVICKVDGNVVESGHTFPLGETTVNCSATDNAGNTANDSFTVTVRDTTGPVLTLPANKTVTAASNSAATVNFASDVSAQDVVDGSRPVTCTPPSGSSFSVGTTTVTCSSSDTRGNTSTGSFPVIVNFNFGGFYSPIDNAPVVNVVKAGQSIPVKFSLNGNQGLNIFATGSPASQKITCNNSATLDQIEETVTAGNSSLSYDATTDRYNYVWKTDKSWGGSCRVLTVTFKDGSSKTALFNFTK